MKPEWANDELRTARLALRHPVASDLEAVLRIHQTPEAVAHNPSDAIEDQAGAGRLLQRWIDHWRRHAVGYWAVSWGGDPSVFGFCGIKVMSLHDRPVANLFYRFDPCVWGRGVASEAASVVVEWALARSPALPVIARVRPDNVASARVATGWAEQGPVTAIWSWMPATIQLGTSRTPRTTSFWSTAGSTPPLATTNPQVRALARGLRCL